MYAAMRFLNWTSVYAHPREILNRVQNDNAKSGLHLSDVNGATQIQNHNFTLPCELLLAPTWREGFRESFSNDLPARDGAALGPAGRFVEHPVAFQSGLRELLNRIAARPASPCLSAIGATVGLVNTAARVAGRAKDCEPRINCSLVWRGVGTAARAARSCRWQEAGPQHEGADFASEGRSGFRSHYFLV